MEEDRVSFVRSLERRPEIWERTSIERALINSLTSEEACHLLDISFEQDPRFRKSILYKIASDLDSAWQTCHDRLVSALLEALPQLPYRKKQSCSAALDYLYDHLPVDRQEQILKLFFESRYVAIRRRAYKKLRGRSEPEAAKAIWHAWDQHRDFDTARLVIESCPTAEIATRFSEIEPVIEDTWLLPRLYTRAAEVDPNRLEQLEQIDGISFTYACVKLGKPLQEEKAIDLFTKHKFERRIGLLIWSLGKLQLWNVLTNIVESWGTLEQEYFEHLARSSRSSVNGNKELA